MYAVICDARAGERLGIDTLVLVDRAKSKRLWWTSDSPEIAMNFANHAAAERAASRLRYNCARVVTADRARTLLLGQSKAIVAEQDEREMLSIIDSIEDF